MSSRGRGGRGGLTMGRRPVSEANRISFSERLKQFQAHDDQVLTFEADLSNHDRAVIHELCKKMGLKSKSSGKGENRRLSVFKIGARQQKGQSPATELSFSAEAQAAMDELFSCFPPTLDEVSQKADEVSETSQPANSHLSEKQDLSMDSSNFCRPLMGKSEIAKQVAMLAARLKKRPALRQIMQERARLPIATFKDKITSNVEKHQVLLISGETGCGKTTQVPQFILDHVWSQGKPCKILCTQPRRISAITVAERIAAERGESIGETVGYQIRLESKGGRHSSLMFCTNGVLLRKLVSSEIYIRQNTGKNQKNSYFNIDATHIIVDEIHERDRNADLILIVLRDLLKFRPDLRLILMSATLNAELFSNYFHNCPVLRIPGFIYPVTSYYLEDVLALTEFGKGHSSTDEEKKIEKLTLSEEDAADMDEAISLAWVDDDFDLFMEMIAENSTPELCNYQHSLTGATALMVAAGKGRVDDVSLLLSHGADCSIVSQDGNTALDWAEKYEQREVRDVLLNHIEKKSQVQTAAEEAKLLEKYLSSIDQEEVDVALIDRLLSRICHTVSPTSTENGAVLIFLPGWEDISRVKERLQASPLFGDTSKFLLLPLHSMVPSNEQRRVFKRPPSGVCKIVLATNIAETAVTIDDVVFVIDSGRMKEKSYDPYSNVSTLQMVWISIASARQREGRAGRCQPGVCYHLFSKVRAAAMPEFQVPEIRRTPLEELCLQVKLLDPNCKIKEFLSKALDPPVELAIHNAIVLLQDIGALTFEEKLTELGRQLGSLPVHPSTCKMLLFAILLNCLDPALTIACATGYRDPFVLPMAPHQKKRAFAARMELTAAYGGYSDHLAVIAAYDRWEEAKLKGDENRFCSQYFVSSGSMAMLAGMRKQLQGELVQKGFIPKELHACSLNAHDPGIVRAVLVAGLYPMIGMLLPPLPNGQKAVVQTARGEKVRIHPHSANFHLVHHNAQRNETLNRPLLVFDEITRGEAWVYVRDCTVVKPHSLLLLATEMAVAPLDTDEHDIDEDKDENDLYDSDEENERPIPRQQEQLMSVPEKFVAVVIDRWLRFQATAVVAAQLHCLRDRLAAAIAFKIKHPRQLLPPILGASVYTIACLLSFDGLLAVSSGRQQANSTSMQLPDVQLPKSPSSTHLMNKNGQVMPQRGESTGSVFKRGAVPASSALNAYRSSSRNRQERLDQGYIHVHQGGLPANSNYRQLQGVSHSTNNEWRQRETDPYGRSLNPEQRIQHVLPDYPLLSQQAPLSYEYADPVLRTVGIDRDIYFKRLRRNDLGY
eukprot:c27681_g1_i1 orf=52-3915(+)